MYNNNALKYINLSSKELEVYKTLLHLGEAGAGDLSKELKIPRTSIYQYLDKLNSLNLVKKVGSKYNAENPVRLNTLVSKAKADLQEKEKVLDILEDEINGFTNQLQNMFFSDDLDSGITKIYRGKDAIKDLYYQTLVEGEIYTFGDMDKYLKIFPSGFGLEKLAREKSLTRYVFDILIDTPASRNNISKETEYYHVKFLPSDFKIVSGFDFLIYNNTTVMIQLSEEPIGVKIESAPIALGFKLMHKTIWNLI